MHSGWACLNKQCSPVRADSENEIIGENLIPIYTRGELDVMLDWLLFAPVPFGSAPGVHLEFFSFV